MAIGMQLGDRSRNRRLELIWVDHVVLVVVMVLGQLWMLTG